jgi:hypothetical protein
LSSFTIVASRVGVWVMEKGLSGGDVKRPCL